MQGVLQHQAKAMKRIRRKQYKIDEVICGVVAISGVRDKDVRGVLKALEKVTEEQLRQYGKFLLPGVVRMKAVVKRGKPARHMKMFGKIVAIKAMPQRCLVKCYAPKSLQSKF